MCACIRNPWVCPPPLRCLASSHFPSLKASTTISHWGTKCWALEPKLRKANLNFRTSSSISFYFECTIYTYLNFADNFTNDWLASLWHAAGVEWYSGFEPNSLHSLHFWHTLFPGSKNVNMLHESMTSSQVGNGLKIYQYFTYLLGNESCEKGKDW